ncbi:carbohydrate-binding domain-containing protein [Aquibacillus rhizosphaerae]|uniref:Carbohydrate-binding domain-containing protein n=1 Tax=Aquibacillus rhizosphaerae TaxID=3051431 RepID=A0ABT7L1S3_9BACI|nr:carbohydrate-binding domain-containing protein [Aquibacillus sp. LR5S19]MDL4839806.1 carbohydrate-binding domain-containing protein [Aquibacillus sp. LR5S19]
MNRKKTYSKMAASILCTTLLFACSNDNENTTSVETGEDTVNTVAVNSEVAASVSDLVTYTDDDYYTDWNDDDPTYIELNGSQADFTSDAAVILSDNILTIKTGGTYVLSGSFDGQIAIDSEDKNTVRIVLNGVEISTRDTAAINVVNAEKTVLSLTEGTENIVSDGETYVYPDEETDEPNAAIFSKDDLPINGTGNLTVNGNYNNGISSKDSLKITSGNISINAVDDTLMGRDLIAIQDGTFTLEAGGDGIKSTNDEDITKGNIVLDGGTFDIISGSDSIQAIASLWVIDGSYNIVAGGGSPETIQNNDGRMQGDMGETTSITTDKESAKALKATVDITVGGGTFTIDSLDDSIHSNHDVTIAGGDFTIATGDDAVHAGNNLTTSDGQMVVTKSYEGLEGMAITIDGGDYDIKSSDDGVNVAGGNDGSGWDIQATEASTLTINGGNISLYANGDGFDSNGSIKMTGGTVIVNGPTNSGNGSLDYDSGFDISGGTIITAGSSGMVQSTSDESSQNSIMMTFSETQAAGTLVHLEDSEGNSIVTFEPAVDYQSVLISSPDIATDETYTLYTGGTASGDEVYGLYTDGYQDGTEVVEFTISEFVTWLDENGVTDGQSAGGFGGDQGGQRGGQTGTFEAPADGEQRTPGTGGGMFGELDEETLAQVQEITQQQRDGTITTEEAEAQLAELGVEFPMMGERPR